MEIIAPEKQIVYPPKNGGTIGFSINIWDVRGKPSDTSVSNQWGVWSPSRYFPDIVFGKDTFLLEGRFFAYTLPMLVVETTTREDAYKIFDELLEVWKPVMDEISEIIKNGYETYEDFLTPEILIKMNNVSCKNMSSYGK